MTTAIITIIIQTSAETGRERRELLGKVQFLLHPRCFCDGKSCTSLSRGEDLLFVHHQSRNFQHQKLGFWTRSYVGAFPAEWEHKKLLWRQVEKVERKLANMRASGRQREIERDRDREVEKERRQGASWSEKRHSDLPTWIEDSEQVDDDDDDQNFFFAKT